MYYVCVGAGAKQVTEQIAYHTYITETVNWPSVYRAVAKYCAYAKLLEADHDRSVPPSTTYHTWRAGKTAGV